MPSPTRTTQPVASKAPARVAQLVEHFHGKAGRNQSLRHNRLQTRTNPPESRVVLGVAYAGGFLPPMFHSCASFEGGS